MHLFIKMHRTVLSLPPAFIAYAKHNDIPPVELAAWILQREAKSGRLTIKLTRPRARRR